MPYFLLTLLIFLSPFIVNPFFGPFFEPPKVIFVEILIELILVITLLKNTSFFKTLNKYQLILSGILLVLTVVSLITLGSFQIFFGNEVRLQGIFLLWHLIILSLLASKLNIDKLPQILFPIGLLFLLLISFWVEPDINGRTVGTLGEANALASQAIFFWPLAFNFSLGSWKDKVLKSGILLIALIVILFSGSRSGMLAFVLQVIFLILTKWINIKKVTLLIVLLLFLTLVLPFIKGGGWYENRSEVWKTAIIAGQQKLLGWGFGNIEQALYQTSLKLNNNLKYQAVDSSHNFLLDYWVQGGIVGLGTIILLIFFSLKGLIRNFKVIEITVLLGLIGAMLFNPASVATLVAFWFILGQGYNYLYGKYR